MPLMPLERLLLLAVLLVAGVHAQCSFTGTVSGKQYDLTPLMGETYSTPNDNIPGTTEHLAVCGSVVSYGTCASNAAVCETSSSGSALTVAINPVTVTEVSEGNLKHTYTKSVVTVVINFACGTSAGTPDYVSEVSGTMTFSWSSIYACPVDMTPPILPTVPPGTTDPCLVQADGQMFVDLTPLSTKTWSTPNSQFPSNMEHIALCGKDTSSISGCPAGAAVCENGDGRGRSFGVLPARLHYEDADPDNTFTLMQFAPADQATSCLYSVIQFVCDPAASDDAGPIHLSNFEDGCRMDFLWKTKYACPHALCAPSVNGRSYSLTALLGKTYSVPNPFYGAYTSHLAVCDDSIQAVPDCVGQQACETAEGARTITLGSAPVSFHEDESGQLMMSYMPSVDFSCSIRFVCDESAGAGIPVLISVGNSFDYIFSWPSVHGCPINMSLLLTQKYV